MVPNLCIRPPLNKNKAVFFNELSKSLSQITNMYDNIIVMGDVNIDTSDITQDSLNYFSDLMRYLFFIKQNN